MGNSTGSMFYLFAIVIVVYIVGASIYQVFGSKSGRRKRMMKSSAWIMASTKNRGSKKWQILLLY